MGFPFARRPIRLFYSIFQAAVVDETSGASIEAPVNGRGFLLHTYDATIGARGGASVHLTSSPILDGSLSILDPAILSNPDPGAAPTVVVREGVSTAGVLPTRPEWIIFYGRESILSGQGSTLYVPQGYTMTFLATAVNESYNAVFGLDEL